MTTRAAATTMPGDPVRKPDGAETVLATLPDAGDGERLRAYRSILSNQPKNLGAAAALAREYLALASARGDPRYAGYARAALAPWWDQEAPPTSVLRLRARYAQYLHDFDGALAALERLLARRPNDANGLLLQASVQRVRGDLSAAAESCAHLEALGVRGWGAACRLEIAALTGRLDAARTELGALLDARDTTAALGAWLHTLGAGMALQAGDAAAAVRHLETARAKHATTDVYRLSLYADSLLRLGRPALVRELLGAHTGVGALLLRLAIAERRLGDAAWRGHRKTLRARFEAAARRDDVAHWRERARAALALEDDPRSALELARRNWAQQRELADARLLVRAAVAAGRPQAAAPVATWVQRHGVQDSALAGAFAAAKAARD